MGATVLVDEYSPTSALLTTIPGCGVGAELTPYILIPHALQFQLLLHMRNMYGRTRNSYDGARCRREKKKNTSLGTEIISEKVTWSRKSKFRHEL